MGPSLETASRVANIANGFFILSLVVGVISTVLIVWTSGVKEAYWDESRRLSDETIATLNKETIRLSADAESSRAAIAKSESETAMANEAAAKANERAALLESQLAPRRLSDDKISILIARFRHFAGQSADICRYAGSVESSRLTDQIEDLLVASGWHLNEYQPLSYRHVVSGLKVEVDPSSDEGTIKAARELIDAFSDVELEIEGPLPLPQNTDLGATWGGPQFRLRLTIGLK
jgi:hypothetical protein